MNKTTEELAAKAGAILPKGVYPNGYLFYPFQLETFRNLVIQNERECAEPVAYVDYAHVLLRTGTGIDMPVGTKLFTFPQEQQEPVMVIGENDEAVCRVLQDGTKLFLEPPAPQPCPECEKWKQRIVMGFYSDEVPLYTQGFDPHEVLEVVTAEDVTSLIDKIKEQAAEIYKIKEVIAKCEGYIEVELAYQQRNQDEVIRDGY